MLPAEDLLSIADGRSEIRRAAKPLAPDDLAGLVVDTGSDAHVFTEVDAITDP